MNRLFLKIMSAILAAVMIVFSAAACTRPDDPKDGTEKPDDSIASAEVSESGSSDAETDRTSLNLLGKRDFKHETVTFYVRQYNGPWDSDIESHELNSEVINDAIYKRTMSIEETYNVVIASVSVGNTGSAVYNKIINEVKGDDVIAFDAINVGLRDTAFLINAGVLQNLKNAPNIDLEAEYWSPFLTKQLSIANKIYGITGEISAEDNMSVRCFFFNKDIAKNNLDLPDNYFYDLVDKFKWNFEEVFKCASDVFSDGGDGIADPSGDGDMFGVTAQAQFGFIMLMGTGTRCIDKKDGDIPYFSLDGNQIATDIVGRLTQSVSGNPSIRIESADENVIKTFTDSKALFMPEVLMHAGTMRTSDVYDIDFGILPMPLYDDTQKEYVQYSDAYCPNFYSIPVKVKGDALDRVTFLLEAIAIDSRDTLTPAYYEICLKGRYSTDEQSSKMIDIILNNYNIDLCDMYLSSWNNFRTSLQNAIKNDGSITTTIKINRKTLNAKIQETVDTIKELPN